MVDSTARLEETRSEEGTYSVYSTRYSDWTNKWNQVVQEPGAAETGLPLGAVAWGVPSAIVVTIFLLAMIMVSFHLREEPLRLLGRK